MTDATLLGVSSSRPILAETSRLINNMGGGGFNPKNPKWESLVVLGFLGFLGSLEKCVESTFLNIPDHLRPTCFLHFFGEISLGSDT